MTIAGFVSPRTDRGVAVVVRRGGRRHAMAAGAIASWASRPPEEEIPPFNAVSPRPRAPSTEGSTRPVGSEPDEPSRSNSQRGRDPAQHRILDGPDDTAPAVFPGGDVPGPGEAVCRSPPSSPATTSSSASCTRHGDEGTVTVSEGAGRRSWRRTPRSTPTRSTCRRTRRRGSPSTTRTPEPTTCDLQGRLRLRRPLFTVRPSPAWRPRPSTSPAARRGRVLLPLRHPPDDGGHGGGGARAASRRRAWERGRGAERTTEAG